MSDAATSTDTPWEFVQDDTDARRGVARVLTARNELVCETTPEYADVIVCAVNYLEVVAELKDDADRLRRQLLGPIRRRAAE